MILHPLSPDQIQKTVDAVLPQLPDGHTGGLAVDIDQDGTTFAAELVKKGDGWTLDAEAAFRWDWTTNDMSAGAKLAWTW